MSYCCAKDTSPYASGIAASTSRPLSHPGGLALTRRALALAGLREGSRLIEIGCGAGESLRLAQSMGYRAVGVDPRKQEHALDDRLILQATAEALPFAVASADAVLSECVLSIIKQPELVIEECARVLAPGGLLIVCDLYARNPSAIAEVRKLAGSCIAGLLVRQELEAELAAAGFSVAYWEDHSRELNEFVAGVWMSDGSLSSLWNCSDTAIPAGQCEAALRSVRAGYFLLIATRCTRRREA